MADRQKSKLVKFFNSRAFLVVIFVAGILVLVGYGRAYYRDYKIRHEIISLQQEVRRLEKKKLETLSILNYVSSPDFVEEKARLELNMRRPGEQVLVIPEVSVSTTVSDIQVEELGKKYLNNPIKWWYYFTDSKSRLKGD
ncbi:MAG TPA: septum formation initiator family protein [Candidatus Magasanikbacteria bacterium]|nr:septum formation initiator family protein [Candidatus Magasanikbacteria bacterium]